MDPDLENMFHELEASSKAETLAERIEREAEMEFNGFSEEHQSRMSEVKSIEEKIKSLEAKLKRYRNVKNIRLKKINEERSKKRKEIRKEIEFCKLRLSEIKDEIAN